ncbi:MAG: methyl-accepting chemotaxis protein [Desulfurivibrionaceae bacterium]
MKMSLRTKVMGIPLALVVVAITLLVAVSLWVINNMWQTQLQTLAKSQAGLTEKSIESLQKQALVFAAFAAQVPGVQEAYHLAHQGNENEGRKLLRQTFDPIHAELAKVLRVKNVEIHFHLPPAKSFLRIWRKAGDRDGGDDLSAFRKTVLKANNEKTQVEGIEVGDQGFAIRGIVPITGPDGQHLGSVEGLMPMGKVFETAKMLETDNVAVYLLASQLEFAKKAKEKNPPIIGDLARIFSSAEKETDPFITEKLLQQAKTELAMEENGGRLVTALPIRDFAGETKGVLVFVRDASDQVSKLHALQWGLSLGGILLLGILSLMLFLSTATITKRLNLTINELEQGGTKMYDAAQEINGTSHQLAEGASEQAASLEETSSSLEEMASMTRRNSEHAIQAETLTKEASSTIGHAGESMQRLTVSMEEISRASEETSRIVKTIDGIAFQTNLLALNAAVEAARAGEAGAGFAVVADEVRNLAMRAAEAAKSTATLIESTGEKVRTGSDLATETNKSFSEVSAAANRINTLISEIASASKEQAHGIDQINKAISHIDSVTQQNAASAEESASASAELSGQAGRIRDIVVDLSALVSGEEGSGTIGIATEPLTSNPHRKTTPQKILSGPSPAQERKKSAAKTTQACIAKNADEKFKDF